MRDKQLKQVVCNHTTGNAEADMLGNILIWVERQNRPFSTKLHRQQLGKYSFLSRKEVALLIAQRRTPSVFRRVLEWFKKPLRKIKALEDKKESQRVKYLSGVRKKRVNSN